jgi:hypothetical protein
MMNKDEALEPGNSGDFRDEAIERFDGQEPAVGGSVDDLCGGVIDYSMMMVIKALEEVTSMSARERNRILESIHGVGEVHNEERSNGVDRGENPQVEISARRSQASATALQSLSKNKPSTATRRIDDASSFLSEEQEMMLSAHHSLNVPFDSEALNNHNGATEQVETHEYDDRSTTTSSTMPPYQVGPLLPPILLPSSSPTHGSSSFIMEKLKELDEALGHIQHKAAYDQALQNSDGYVEDPKFRLIFLRADSFDACRAATRLVSFMEEKLHRFGPDALTRQLTMDDLSRTSRSLLVKRGVMQILPARDSSGRAILVTYFHFVRLQDELRRHPASLVRVVRALLENFVSLMST